MPHATRIAGIAAAAGALFALAGPACGARSSPETTVPLHEDETAERMEALEASIARLEQRQLQHMEKQSELARELEELRSDVGGDKGGERPSRSAPPGRPEPPPGLGDPRGRPDEGASRPPRRPPERPARPDPNEVYAVPTGGAPEVGPEDAPVTIVKAFEFACPYCYRARATVSELRDEYGDDIRVVYRNFVVRPREARTPALAACAAAEQGRHEDMMELIWERGFEAGRDFSGANMRRLARELELDVSRFDADMEGEACSERLERDREVMGRFGTRGVPMFFINGRPVAGAQPARAFRRVIDEELERARERIAEGTEPGAYYETWVEGEGEPALR